jgi:adenylate cyclase
MTDMQLESISISDFPLAGGDALADLVSRFGLDEGSRLAEIEDLFASLLAIQQSALSQRDVYQRAASALVQLVGLDEGLVVLASSDDWCVTASYASNGHPDQKFSPAVLEKVVAEKQTYFQTGVSGLESPLGENAQIYVAAPILDRSDRVIGVLFGVRRIGSVESSRGIVRLEALLVTLFACSAGCGLMRENGHADRSRFQMQLEQFASPTLVNAMKHDPSILEAREREITVLFSDIRGFTGLSERVGAEKTFTMISNLMNQLTGCILDEEGFIMGYSGDGIAAMWNAPADQPDHAELACWAAVNMQKVMSKLSEFWSFVSGEELEARIGICTGKAHVGNSGSRWRMHYSPIGPCVNLASRLEGANKYFGTSILITESTKQCLFSTFQLRRIGPVVTKGTDRAAEVYQIFGEGDGASPPYVQDYEAALELFERSEYENAYKKIVSAIKRNGDQDQAACELKSQIERHMSMTTDATPCIRLAEK